MNSRQKTIAESLDFCIRFKHFLNDWEKGFIESIENQTYELTSKQFNILFFTGRYVLLEVISAVFQNQKLACKLIFKKYENKNL